jgi:hypothetical protein
VDFFDVFDDGEGRAGREVVFESFDARGRAFGEGFDAPVRQIAHVARDLVACGGALGEEPIADALHLTVDQKFARDLHPSCASQRARVTIVDRST